MNTFAASRLDEGRRIAHGRSGIAAAFSRAWSSLAWRHWLLAAGIGVVVGALDGVFVFLYFFKAFAKLEPAPVLFYVLLRWVALMAAVACALAFALALLRDLGQRAAVRPRHVVLAIVAVSACGSFVVDPIVVGGMYVLFGRPPEHFVHGVDWWTALSRMYSQTGEKIVTFVATVTLSVVYYLKGLRTSDALATAQLGLSRAQKRRLTEELRSAQSALDPDFLFATFDEVDRRFESNPQAAQRLLEALIRYLRAALPPSEDTIGTLGQQTTLVRAWLEVEGIRCGGRLRAQIEVPAELDGRPFAPALMLPVVVLVVGDAARSGVESEIRVSASVAEKRLTVAVRAVGCDRPATAADQATLESLRQRLAALYGSTAALSLATEASGASAATIVIDDPGNV